DAATGNTSVEVQRLEGLRDLYASAVGAAGRVYMIDREGGAVVLRKTNKVEVLARNHLDDGFDASPAVAGNQLFLRGKQFLYCLSESR
ncbi:MAG: hypothetical protein WC740_24015, partial [Verrucomicrobiia bacterium]